MLGYVGHGRQTRAKVRASGGREYDNVLRKELRIWLVREHDACAGHAEHKRS